MKYSELRRLIEDVGCSIKRHGKEHDLYYSPITEKVFAVGRHMKQEVAIGTLHRILRDSGVK